MTITKLKVSSLLILVLAIFLVGCDNVKKSSVTTTPPTATVAAPPSSTLTAPAKPQGFISLDKNYYFVLDGSGSMNASECAGKESSRIAALKKVVTDFINKVLPPDVNAGLYIFDNNGNSERVPLSKNNRAAIFAQVAKIQGGNGTPLNHAIVSATNALVKQRVAQAGYGEFYIVVATDGEAGDGKSSGGDMTEGVGAALQNKIPIITIGFCLGQTHALAMYSLVYRDVKDPDQLLTALKDTVAESENFDPSTFKGK